MILLKIKIDGSEEKTSTGTVDIQQIKFMINIQLDFTNQPGSHDMILYVEEVGLRQEADTYYFALDACFMKGDESPRKLS